MNKTYMLDTCICSFIMREQPEAVLKRLEQAVLRGHRIVVSAITWAEVSLSGLWSAQALKARRYF